MKLALVTKQPLVQFFTSRNLLAFLTGTGIYMGFMLRNPALLFIGFTSLFVLVYSYWQASRLLRTLSILRVHQPRAFEGDSIPVTLELTNDTDHFQPLVLVEDYFPPGDVYKVHHLVEQSIKPRQTLRLKYTGECNRRRGLYTLGPVKLQAFDSLGLYRRYLSVDEFTFLLVYPAAVDLHMTEVLGDGTLARVGIETIMRPGASTEFTGVRPYRIGDSPNTIHWRSTARTGNLIVKEFQEIMTTEVSFFVDLGRMGLTGLGDQTSIEYAIKSTASLAKLAVEKAHAVQLFTVGKEIQHTELGKGQRHLLMILDHLALLKSEGESDFLNSVLEYLPLLRSGGTVVLAVSATTIKFEKMRLVISLMLQRRLLPVVILIDDRAFVKLFREQESAHGEAISLEDTARLLVLEGARVHLVTKAPSQEQALLQGLERDYLADE